MNQPTYFLNMGTKVKTHDVLESTDGMLINGANLKAREGGKEGKIAGVVGGHGGDVYWVQHDDRAPFAAYCFTEFELIP